ncbi:hypothetical protein, partial [Pseudomonas syringae]|uniref:hypothetical protein n=1 Tax=Pseudomonas syringae TaxID=317 RepID=UPI000C0A700D
EAEQPESCGLQNAGCCGIDGNPSNFLGSVQSMGTIVKTAATAAKVLFSHGGADDAECDVSDRAKEPDEVGPETGAKGFGYFGLIKVTRRGAKR